MNARTRTRTVVLALAAASVALVTAACGSSSSSSSDSTTGGGGLSGTLNGSGSSLQLPYEQQAIEDFKKVQSGVTVNYGGGGSGKGRTDLAQGVVDFAGSDSPIKPADQATFKGTVLYFPIVIAPITVSYNLSGVSGLQLSGPTLAKIFQGDITSWNDAAIAAENAGVTLPSTPIVIARRSDSSGTTDNFSKFLDQSSGGAWKLGTGSTLTWPASSQGGNGNGGVAQVVKATAGAIGYVDYSDAKAAGLTLAKIKNKAGTYVDPSTDAASAAAAATTLKPDLTFSAIWADGASAYPITGQSWVLVYAKQPSQAKADALKAWIGYLIGDGQGTLPGLDYAALPDAIKAKAQAQLASITA
jgi:phosphate transport system substrate-binding protein